MEPIIKMTDHAAAQGDRWLFVFLLIFLLVFCGLFFRWLLKDREAVVKRLTEITDKHIAQTATLAEVVTLNSRVVDNNTNALKEFTEKMAMCVYRNNPQAH